MAFHKRNWGITKLFRLILSLVVMAILGIGLLLALKSFSGVNPLKVSPQASLKSLFTSESIYQLVAGLLTADPKTSLEKAKELLKGDQGILKQVQDDRGNQS